MIHFARFSRPVVLVAGNNRKCRSYACVMTLSSLDNTTPKRKMSQIGTHNGTFHCDEALGCFLLQQTDRFKNAEVVRSRDQDVLKDLDIVIDVGGVYDHSTSSQLIPVPGGPPDVRIVAHSQSHLVSPR